jgi:hypothetical protein
MPERATSQRSTPASLDAALGSLASSSAAPYGYTISVWSSGAVLIHSRGLPNVGEVFMFAAGALAGFTFLGLLAHRRLAVMDAAISERERVLAGVLHWFAVGAAVGAVALIAQIPSWIAWPLGMFTGTVLYLIGASVQLALVTGRRRI